MFRYTSSHGDYGHYNVYGSKIVVTNRRTHTEQTVFKHKLRIIVGVIMGLIGLVGWIMGSNLMLIVMPMGVSLSIWNYKKNKNWIKGAKGEAVVFNYLKHLPNQYIILNDLNIPKTFGNIDHVVLGPSGIFTIETKNFKGSYVVEENEWYFTAGSKLIKTYKNPGDQIKTNTGIFSNFLTSKGMKSHRSSTFPVVAFINPNLTIKHKPKHYNVIHPSALTKFIIGQRKKLNKTDVRLIAALLNEYSAELSYSDVVYPLRFR